MSRLSQKIRDVLGENSHPIGAPCDSFHPCAHSSLDFKGARVGGSVTDILENYLCRIIIEVNSKYGE